MDNERDSDVDSERARARASNEASWEANRKESRREVITVIAAGGSIAAIYLALVLLSGRSGTADDYWRASRR